MPTARADPLSQPSGDVARRAHVRVHPSARGTVESVCNILTVADRHNAAYLKDEAVKFVVSQFAEVRTRQSAPLGSKKAFLKLLALRASSNPRASRVAHVQVHNTEGFKALDRELLDIVHAAISARLFPSKE
eukprot:1568856-Prymnesium_polylepis.1